MKGDFSRWTFDSSKHYHGVLKQQGRVDLDADWNEQGAIVDHRVETETLDVVGQCGAPIGDAGFMLSVDTTGKIVSISAGRAYVDGILCENPAVCALTAQPDAPGFALPTAPGVYAAYLKVWLRHIIALDDPNIREDALGGPDTCTRMRTVWQVGLLEPKVTGAIACATDLPEWGALIAPSTGTLAARAQPDPTATDPCMIPAKAGYRSLENQLYRVEIHAGSATGKPTFKWSRDNGSVVTSWLSETGGSLAVSSVGRDAVLGFAAGQWVELTDDTHDLNFLPGTLAQIKNVEDNTITIEPLTAIGPTAIANFPLNPRVRRWDSAGALPVTASTWINLEDGVQVEFSSGSYTTGDYWLIPARTLKADVDWPQDSSGNPAALTPKGVIRHYGKLALLMFNGSAWTVTSNCLATFPPLTSLSPASAGSSAIHITGVRFLKPAANFLNDSDVPLAMLSSGIAVVCDAPVATHSIKRPTCFVTVEVPFWGTSSPLASSTLSVASTTLSLSNAAPAAAPAPAAAAPATGLTINPAAVVEAAPILGYQPLILAANTSLSADSSTVQWLPATAAILTFLQDILQKLQANKQPAHLLAHLTLKGNFIWGPADAKAGMYLDGEAYGIPRLTNPSDATSVLTSLNLPKSGDGLPGGDFEMWFWLTLPVSVVSVTFNPNPVFAGSVTDGTVTLSAPAPAGGAVVTLTPNTPGLATIPASVTVPAGQISVTFTVTGAQLASGAATSNLQVTGTYLQSAATGTLTINMAPPK